MRQHRIIECPSFDEFYASLKDDTGKVSVTFEIDFGAQTSQTIICIITQIHNYKKFGVASEKKSLEGETLDGKHIFAILTDTQKTFIIRD